VIAERVHEQLGRLGDLALVERVVHMVPAPIAVDQAGLPQHSQVLGNGRLAHPEPGGQRIDTQRVRRLGQ